MGGHTEIDSFMEKKTSSIVIFSIILIASIFAGFFVYPGNFGNSHLPWRMGLDLVGGSTLIYKVDLAGIPDSEHSDAVAGLKEVIERRVNLFGVAEPRVNIAQKEEGYQLLIDLAGIQDIQEAIDQIGETPVLDFRELDLSGDEPIYVQTELTGRYITSATLEFDQFNQPIVSLQLSDEGAVLFEEITGRNIGRPLAVFLDNELKNEPIVQGKISGGRAQITFGASENALAEAKLLVERFNAGALSAPIELVNQRTVSPSAAGDSLNRIIIAWLVGTAAVMLFMISYYRTLGIFSVFALAIYTALTLALFKVIPNFTMTLAGIAGFVLSIGLAVDANILIFERTKEEIKKGLRKIDAINEGFKRAWPSIRDSNISTIITAVILYFFTSSFVRGFALTLGFGVMMSMFSAIFVTRTMLRIFMRDKS